MNGNEMIKGLGVVATGKRRIYEGREYYDMFPQPTGTDPIVNDNAEVHDTLHFVAKVVKETLRDTRKVARALKRSNILTTSRAVFDFFYKHYAYKLDKYGVEQVRRPARAWRDRKEGIDCDCFTTSVSSILTNLGIDHYLKIIAINGRPNFQHIYVIVPKFKGADINVRGQYWVIDPVLNRFDEEAPNITKTDYLKMEGIPLQYLNGIDAEVAGLGKEFDTLETSLAGIDDMEGMGFARFRQAMHAHVKNTRRKIRTTPSAVEAVYEPRALEGLYGEIEAAFEGTSDDQLISKLEAIAAREHAALQPRFRHVANAIHTHDDHLYGAAFGDIDDQMISVVSGLGRKGRSANKQQKANKKVKTGPATKIKNAVKKAKTVTKKAAVVTKAAAKKGGAAAKATAKKAAAKSKVALKKIGKGVVKYNPVSVAARGGFLTAMRTNFSKIAEKAYWGYQTKEFALSKGINADYYDRCVQLLAKIRKTFVGTLKGQESALKKAILNGRAAKKIALQLKKKGMSGIEQLMGLGSISGLGAVTEATITASMAFLTPILTMMNKLFKGKKSGIEASRKAGRKSKKNKNGSPVEDSVENENGTESEAASDNASENMNEAITEASNPSETINENDGSVEAANRANDEEPSEDSENFNKTSGRSAKPEGSTSNSSNDEGGSGAKSSKGGNTGLVVGAGLAVVALALIAGGKKKSNTAVNGLGNFSAKRESKTLKKKLAKKGIKLPHGYKVEKREKLRTVNI